MGPAAHAEKSGRACRPRKGPTRRRKRFSWRCISWSTTGIASALLITQGSLSRDKTIHSCLRSGAFARNHEVDCVSLIHGTAAYVTFHGSRRERPGGAGRRGRSPVRPRPTTDGDDERHGRRAPRRLAAPLGRRTCGAGSDDARRELEVRPPRTRGERADDERELTSAERFRIHGARAQRSPVAASRSDGREPPKMRSGGSKRLAVPPNGK